MSAEDDTARQRWRQLRELFDLALEQPAGERERFLEAIFEARRVPSGTQQELREMLAADRAQPTDPERVDALAPDLLEDLHQSALTDPEPRSGSRFGPWLLMEKIGQGGMGAVWRVERSEGDFRLQGALKRVRQGWDSLELRQRFRRERKILAGLRHPNIAALLDGGESDAGQPWLVMEYVPGRALLTHCDEEQLEVRARLELFLSICAAVAHAHRNLVVHRDLKPSNILVDPEGRIKLLDFGIARLLDSDLAQTGTGQRLFTPEYAAPEQVRGDPVTTSVDVHALGLLLYGLLTGLRPWGQSGSTPAAYEYAILRVEATLPSRALLADPASAARSRERGGLSPPRLSALLKGDLDAIVMKALRKLPSERYASVDELADDVRRHLHAEPVLARRGNWRYRARRFLRRHALASALGAVALLSLLIGLGAALHQAERAESARQLTLQALQRAERESRRAAVVATFMTDSFRLADPGRANQAEPSAKDLLERGLSELDQRRDLDAETRAALLLAIGDAWNGLGALSRAMPLFEEALTLAEQRGDPKLAALSMMAIGTTHLNLKAPESALQWLGRAREALQAGAALDPTERQRLDTLTAAGLNNLGRRAEAADLLEPAWQQLRAELGPDSREALEMQHMLVYMLPPAGRADRAFELSADAYRRSRDHPALPLTLRRNLQDAHAFALLNRGTTEAAEAAESIFRESQAIAEQLYGPGTLGTHVAVNNVATALSRQDRLEAAIAVRQQAHRILTDALPPDDGRILGSTLQLSWDQLKLGDFPGARQRLLDATRGWTLGAESGADQYRARFQLGLAHEQLDELDEATTQVRAAAVSLQAGVLPATSWWQQDLRILEWRLSLRDPRQSPDCARGDQLLAASGWVPAQLSELHAQAALCRHRAGEPARARVHLTQLDPLPTPRSEYLRRELPALRAAAAPRASPGAE